MESDEVLDVQPAVPDTDAEQSANGMNQFLNALDKMESDGMTSDQAPPPVSAEGALVESDSAASEVPASEGHEREQMQEQASVVQPEHASEFGKDAETAVEGLPVVPSAVQEPSAEATSDSGHLTPGPLETLGGPVLDDQTAGPDSTASIPQANLLEDAQKQPTQVADTKADEPEPVAKKLETALQDQAPEQETETAVNDAASVGECDDAGTQAEPETQREVLPNQDLPESSECESVRETDNLETAARQTCMKTNVGPNDENVAASAVAESVAVDGTLEHSLYVEEGAPVAPTLEVAAVPEDLGLQQTFADVTSEETPTNLENPQAGNESGEAEAEVLVAEVSASAKVGAEGDACREGASADVESSENTAANAAPDAGAEQSDPLAEAPSQEGMEAAPGEDGPDQSPPEGDALKEPEGDEPQQQPEDAPPRGCNSQVFARKQLGRKEHR